MTLRALLIIQDPESLRVLRRVLDELRISVESTGSVDRSGELLAKHRYDAIVVDCDDLSGAPALLRRLRQSPSNKRSLAFAIVNGKTTVGMAFDSGANFVLDKPVTAERVMRSFRAAHGLMMRERRRYYRNPLNIKIQLTTAENRELSARLVNLSEGGMAVSVAEPLPANATVRLKFSLPGVKSSLEAKAAVSWISNGKLGLRFLHMEQRMQRDLEQWIGSQSEKEPITNTPIFINATAAAKAQ